MKITDAQVSLSLAVTILVSAISGVWWASQNLVMASDMQKSHLEIRLEVEQQANEDRVERYRRELRYHTDTQVIEDIKQDISDTQARNRDIKQSLTDLEAKQ